MRMLLDTSVYSQPIKRHPLPSVVVHWKAAPESEYAVSAIAELEVLYGIALSGSDRLRDSTALVHGLELATCNAADFSGIPGLRVSDWSKPE